jgi:hypothetical protein
MEKHRTLIKTIILLLIVQNRFQTETELLSCKLVAHVAAWQHRWAKNSVHCWDGQCRYWSQGNKQIDASRYISWADKNVISQK